MTISEAIEKIFRVVRAVQKALSEDSAGGKKVTLTEGIGIAISTIGLVPAITAFQQLAEDWKSRDAAKKEAWVTAFKENFDLPDDELEAQIENAVEAILKLEEFITVLN